MSVKTMDNSRQLSASLAQRTALALRLVLDGIDSRSTPVTPQRTGGLRRDKLKQVVGLRASISWDKNYAGFQETKQFQHYTTPGTGRHFAENAVKREAIDNAGTYFRRAGVI